MAAHRPLQMARSQMEKEIVGSITRQNLLSANKRVRTVGSDE